MNKTLLIVMGVMVLVALILGGILFSSYNTLVTKQQNVKAQWSLVENQMQRRADLIPNIVATVKGVPRAARGPLFVIEAISHFVRIISLSVRLFANLLAGHLLILFMGGGMVVLLGAAYIGPLTVLVAIGFFLFEVGIVAGLQAFIFATLTSIYLGGATAEAH